MERIIIPHCPISGPPTTVIGERLDNRTIRVTFGEFNWDIPCDFREHGRLILIDGRLLEGGMPHNARVLASRGLTSPRAEPPFAHIRKVDPLTLPVLERRKE